MDDRTLVSIIKSHRRDSLGYESGDLSQQRAAAMDHYHGRPYGNEITGRSQVVSRDLSETVDWAMPAIMKAFIQSGSVVEFDPVGPEDEQMAQQESDYTNQVIMKDNAGFMVLHDGIKDILLLKNGYAKHKWLEEDKTTTECYSGLSMEQITQMISQLEESEAKVEIVGQERKLVPMPGLPMLPMMQGAEELPEDAPAPPGMAEVFEIKLKITRKKGRVSLEATPAEEVRVSKKCRGSLQDSPFTEHVTLKTRSELIEMGMPRSFVDDLPSFSQQDNSLERLARDSVLDEADNLGASVTDRSMDEIEFCEAYLKVDYDGDGVAELRKVVTVADKIPPGDDWNEEIQSVPMSGGVAKRVPHRHVGESLDDELQDLQEIMTVLKRQLLDNIYLTNNSQLLANERANLKDLMTSTPGGIKRIKGEAPVQEAVSPLVVKPIIGDVLPVLDYFGQAKEQRTGITKASVGMDPDVLRDATKGAFMENLNRASQKIEMITRMIAETFVKEIALQVHSLLIRHQDKPRVVQMRGKWVNVNPQEWKERTDLTVRVGLGTGNEEEKRNKLAMLQQMQGQLLQACVAAPPQVYAKMYTLFADLAKAMGFDIPEKYAIAPDGSEYKALQQSKPQQPPDPKMMQVQADAQAEQARLQQEGMLRQAEMRMQAQVDAHRQQVEAQQQQARMTMELELERQRNAMDMQLAREKAQMQAQIDVMLARIKAEAQIDAAQIAAQTTLTTAQEQASDNAVGDTD